MQPYSIYANPSTPLDPPSAIAPPFLYAQSTKKPSTLPWYSILSPHQDMAHEGQGRCRVVYLFFFLLFKLGRFAFF